MKNKMIVAAAAAAGAALITYLVKRRRNSDSKADMMPFQKIHHRTQVFSNAKMHLS